MTAAGRAPPTCWPPSLPAPAARRARRGPRSAARPHAERRLHRRRWCEHPAAAGRAVLAAGRSRHTCPQYRRRRHDRQSQPSGCGHSRNRVSTTPGRRTLGRRGPAGSRRWRASSSHGRQELSFGGIDQFLGNRTEHSIGLGQGVIESREPNLMSDGLRHDRRNRGTSACGQRPQILAPLRRDGHAEPIDCHATNICHTIVRSGCAGSSALAGGGDGGLADADAAVVGRDLLVDEHLEAGAGERAPRRSRSAGRSGTPRR